MEKTEDRRTRKTKKAMTEALAQLLAEKPLNNISVREIADRADINRGTFYLYYHDVYDMAEQLQNEIIEKWNKIVEHYELKTQSDKLFPVLAGLFQLLAENAALTRVLAGKNGDAAFVDKLKSILREKCFHSAQKVFGIQNDEEFRYFYHYIVSGCIGILGAWLDGGMRETPHEMAAFVERLIVSSVSALTDHNAGFSTN